MNTAFAEHLSVDYVVVGSGFSGSLVALALRRSGRTVALVERGHHPRFAIGESSTPLANLLLEEFADRYGLPQLRVFSKWGRWQRSRPDIAGGLKRGFTFFFHRPHEAFEPDDLHARELLVEASPRDEIGDTHWYRPDFDGMLVNEAEREGVRYLDETQLASVEESESRITVGGMRNGHTVQVEASFLIDASGPRGFLHRALNLPAAPLRWLPPVQGLYSHFENVERWDSLVVSSEKPPYPVDDAAVHHVFDGGWIWILRFNNGITSAGAALIDERAEAIRATEGAPAWERLLADFPSIGEQFRRARNVIPFVHSRRLASRIGQVCGRRWALLPSAAGVIDPLLSTGFALTLLGIQRLVDILESTSDGLARETALRAYARHTQDELDVTEQLVAGLYASMSDPELFTRLSLLYFAALTYSEAARRLAKPELAPGFLLHAHPRFGPELRGCAAQARENPRGALRDALLDRISRAIEPFDVAGLLEPSRRNWYPARAADLLNGTSKLGATAQEIQALLERCGFAV